jgi:NitT/TauT family transport system permease protein
MPTNPTWRKVWGEATALLHRARLFGWVDLLVVLALGGLLYGLLDLASEWTARHAAGEHRAFDIDLSPLALPRYTFFSLARGLVAYAISLLFTLGYGYWAAKDRRAERILLPMLDILQSIPVLGFLPGLLLALKALFPTNNVGLELASIFMIFTGQAWNMTFSFYHSLRSVPLDQREVATIYRFSSWQRFKWVELPFSMIGLVWNSMMSMAGGWFFLMLSESFRLGKEDFRLPGIGSYMTKAVDDGNVEAMLWAILAMTLMIVGLDQLLWRPVVVWAQKFRVEEGGAGPAQTSWFLTWLRRSRLLGALGHLARRREAVPVKGLVPRPPARRPGGAWESGLALVALLALLAGLLYGVWLLLQLVWDVSLVQWGSLGADAGLTLGRVLLSTAAGTLWALPAGLAIGLSPRLARALQPVVQVVASFPAPMLFPLVIAAMHFAGVPLGWGSILLMLLGTQWYILFNVVAGAMAIPADLREAAHGYRLAGWRRFWVLYFPAVFPYLVTGWITAAGGAWNTSIVAEYVTFKDQAEHTDLGLGATISAAAARADFALLAAAVTVMALVVVLFNRTVWRRLYRLAEERFALNK